MQLNVTKIIYASGICIVNIVFIINDRGKEMFVVLLIGLLLIVVGSVEKDDKKSMR